MVRVGVTSLAVLVLVSACGGPGIAESQSAENPTPTRGDVQIAAKDFEPSRFDRPTRIVNRWLPLKPGTRYVYVGGVTDEGRRLGHRVVMTVTDLTKLVSGVRTLVIDDRDYTGGHLVEAELAFFAQDNDGNVWLFGEYPEEFEAGDFAGAPDTWIAGLQRARPGILMRAHPRLGTSSYLQGWAPTIEFADRARVYKTGVSTCVPFHCYEGVLVTDEWNPDEPAAHQRKYYAAGVGNVRVGHSGDDPESETLALADLRQLGAREMERARLAALRRERRAYAVSDDLYGRTSPAKRL